MCSVQLGNVKLSLRADAEQDAVREVTLALAAAAARSRSFSLLFSVHSLRSAGELRNSCWCSVSTLLLPFEGHLTAHCTTIH